MIKQLLRFLRLHKKDDIGGYKIHLDDLGFYDIKVGDKFEGCACGNFFGDQTCRSADGGDDGYVLGTTTLVTFRKSMIRPIKKDGAPPFIETYGVMNDCKRELSKLHKMEVK